MKAFAVLSHSKDNEFRYILYRENFSQFINSINLKIKLSPLNQSELSLQIVLGAFLNQFPLFRNATQFPLIRNATQFLLFWDATQFPLFRDATQLVSPVQGCNSVSPVLGCNSVSPVQECNSVSGMQLRLARLAMSWYSQYYAGKLTLHKFFLLQIRYLQNAHQPAALYRLKAADILAANETELRTDEENCEYYSVCSTFDTNFAKTLSELTNLFLNIPLNMLQNTK